MATIEENYAFWNDRCDWTRYGGDQWSARWGGPEAQWRWSVYPRIRRHLPAGVILEIGPGHGRWTRFLKDHCEELVVVDISETCLEVCREKFAAEKLRYLLGDGRTLAAVDDCSVDFIFSFESLIHTELDDLTCYIGECARVLKDGGAAFLHHSNLGAYGTYFKTVDRLPRSVAEALKGRGLLDYYGWRARSVSAENVQKAIEKGGLFCVGQELVPWGGRRMIDCFSTFQVAPLQKSGAVVENRHFLRRAEEIRHLSRLYGKGESWLSGGPLPGKG